MMSTKSEGSYLPILVVICAPVLGPAGDKPLSHQPIDGWREWRRACEAVTNAKDPRTNRGAPLRLVRLHPPTLTNLREKCHAGRTHPAYPMVHLIGYVPGDRLLRMEQENGREEVVTPEDLASAFRDAGVQIVLLNICSGFEFASALVEQAGVQTVVTTHCAISDPEAILLVQKIYPRLAFGDSIGDALDFAKASIVEAYRQGDLPPLDNVDRDRRNLEQYGQQRAANIVLCGDANVRLQLPPSSEAAAEPEFDLSEPPNNLSHFDDIFIGRGVELVRISDWMDEHHFRTIALTGIGGIGKSSLAIATARRNCWRFHGVIYLTAKNTAGHYQSLSPDDVCRQVEVVLELDSPSSPPSQKDRYKRVKEVLNAHPYLLILDNLEVLTEKQSTELAGFLQLLDPRSGTVVLLTLRPEHFRPLVDKMKSEFYPLSVESLDSLDAVVLLYELLKLPVEREPTTDEWDVWEKVPSRPVMPRDQARLEWLADRADVPDDKVAALEELAEAAHRHPLLLRFATANLKEPAYDWDGVLRRLRGLKGDDLKEKVEDMIGKMCDDLARRRPGALT
ncbi:hypothetical protein HYR99_18155 [Candidatus Poribacteria bacterium]|nr:hypothetical protein [Candidatus Poribacteria bacterium]